jgi:succinate dehydrogenase hydrophobic anchor subunit
MKIKIFDPQRSTGLIVIQYSLYFKDLGVHTPFSLYNSEVGGFSFPYLFFFIIIFLFYLLIFA